MRVKICGITKPDQGCAIAQLGANSLGFICVSRSPRYVTPEQIREIVDHLQSTDVGQTVDRVGVFADATIDDICRVVEVARLNVVQLHGDETTQMCQAVRQTLPGIEVVKAVRVRCMDTLQQASSFQDHVDALLLDAYHPDLLGGTGKTLDWSSLRSFRPSCSWILAGGLTPDNILNALELVNPDGIDLSSGVELAPGDKDLQKVMRLFEQLRQLDSLDQLNQLDQLDLLDDRAISVL